MSLSTWLARLERLDPNRIELGLERVARVADLMGVRRLPGSVVVTVAGTNGKGSTVALLEAVLTAAGYRVGAYTSPHLVRYTERIRIGGREVDEEALCGSFERVERERGATPLTYFEFGTLAALDLFSAAGLDAVVLEVGLGGRLDAVNVIDSDVALLTSIGIDHTAWLGTDREAIGAEKAGVLRPGRPAVCADPVPPASVLKAAAALGSDMAVLGRDFGYERERGGAWGWWGPGRHYRGLPPPRLPGAHQLQNAAGVLMGLEWLAARLPVSTAALAAGLRKAELPGRYQRLPGPVPVILDVAHNADGIARLAETLSAEAVSGRTHAVFGALDDKDIAAMAAAIAPAIDAWYVAPPQTPRAASAGRLRDCVSAPRPGAPVTVCENIAAAYAKARAAARPGDRVVVFGSFYTVGEVLCTLDR